MKADGFFRKVLDKIKACGACRARKRAAEQTDGQTEEEWDENPYLFMFRSVMEQVLACKNISYREFSPILIDEEKPELLLMEEDIFTVLHQLERDLNALAIITDRPEEFFSYAARVEEETGLLVSVLLKSTTGGAQLAALHGNVILDFERRGNFCTADKTAGCCYIPIYKIPWRKGENLDIAVPIGYNTVIVKEMEENGENRDSDRIAAEFQRK